MFIRCDGYVLVVCSHSPHLIYHVAWNVIDARPEEDIDSCNELYLSFNAFMKGTLTECINQVTLCDYISLQKHLLGLLHLHLYSNGMKQLILPEKPQYFVGNIYVPCRTCFARAYQWIFKYTEFVQGLPK